MPKTTIHEYCHLVPSKNKIRLSKHGLISPPAGDSVAAEKFHHFKLGAAVATPTDLGHDLRSFGFGENIAMRRGFHLLARRLPRLFCFVKPAREPAILPAESLTLSHFIIVQAAPAGTRSQSGKPSRKLCH